MTWYTGDVTYDTVLTAALVFVALVAVAAWFVPSPYGRFSSAKYGMRLDPRLGWLLMELPSTVVFLAAFSLGPRRTETVPLIFLGVWLIHYANRGFYFPLRIRVPKGSQSSFSLMVVAIGWVSTSLHGYLNGAFVSGLSPHLDNAWLTDPRFIGGLA